MGPKIEPGTLALGSAALIAATIHLEIVLLGTGPKDSMDITNLDIFQESKMSSTAPHSVSAQR